MNSEDFYKYKKEKIEKRRRARRKKKIVLSCFLGVLAAGAAATALAFILPQLHIAYKENNPYSYSTAEEAISAAEQLIANPFDPESAIRILDANIKKDKNGAMAQKRGEYIHLLSEAKQSEAYTYIKNYDYISAAQLLESAVELDSEAVEPTLHSLYSTCLDFANTAEWTGAVEHVFFHSLIYDATKTFTGDYQTQDFDESYVTVTEFKRLLDRFYQSGFILYDIKKLCTVNPDGSVAQNPIYVPHGKKPLVMSFDDACYYEYMRPYGFVHGVTVDEQNMIKTFIWNDDGTKQIIEDGDYEPILEEFIKEHPDFTYGGARGTMALTGYDGVLGYRTNNLADPNYPLIAEEAIKVAERLKESGWTFASHSYGHRDFYERDAAWYANDTARWINEVVPIIGPTDIFIYPFGTAPTDWNDPKQQNFIASGFKIFCGVFKEADIQFHGNFMFMQRRNIDGIAFRDGRLDSLMDMSGIMETEARPF